MEHRHGGDIYEGDIGLDFSANINFRGMPDRVRRAAIQAVDQAEAYPDPSCRKVRALLAGQEGVTAEQIVCGNGASELLYAVCRAGAFCTGMVLCPSFYEYEQAIRIGGGRVLRHFLREEEGFLPGRMLIQAIRESRPEVLFIGNPNNPTGRAVPGEVLREILKACAEAGTLAVIDESFYQYLGRFGGTAGVPAGTFLLRSMTKMFAMPGLRFGYGICTDEAFLEQVRRQLPPWNVSGPAQAAACACTEESQFAEESARMNARIREKLAGQLRDCGFRVIPSDANFLLFHADTELYGPLREKGILIRSCANFPGLGEGWYRVCVRSPEENEILIRRILAVPGTTRQKP